MDDSWPYPILDYNPDGGIPVGPVSNPPVYSQADVTQLIEGQAYIDVVFGSIQTATDWVLVECDVVNTADLTPLNIWPGLITNRTTAGFRVYLNGLPDTANYYLHWAVSGVNIAPSQASTYLLTGPNSGPYNPLSEAFSSNFTVALPPSSTLPGSLTVTPNDGGAGGTFSPSSVVLSTVSASAVFRYSPAGYGVVTIGTTNSGTLSNPASLTFTAVAAAYTLSGPGSGSISVASTNFTVALPVGGLVSGTVTVTPNDGGGGGTFTPTTVGLTTGAPSATFTYTPVSTGAKTISTTNNGGLTDPGSLTYTVTAHVYKRTLTVDHTKVPSTQTDFPVLVSITDATLKTIANSGHVQRSDGFDIGFYSDSGITTKLKWEIEKYDPTTGELVAWVKIASVSSSADTLFYLSYGDPAITTNQADPVNVWTNSFVGVYHLGNGTTLSPNDSLGALNGTLVNTPTATTGKIDGGGNFVKASVQYIDFAASSMPPAMTVSCWIKGTSFPAGYNCIIEAGTVGGFFVSGTSQIAIYWANSTFGPIGYDSTGSHTLSTGVFYHLVVTYNSVVGLASYVNAAVDFAQAASGTLNTTSHTSRIGSDPGTAGREWNGVLDEVRVSSIARSVDWITAEYNNQNAPGTFITVGVET